MKKYHLFFFLILTIGNLFAQNQYYISVQNGNDQNNGSINSPFKTISKALTVSTSGSIIHILPGTYNTNSGETFPLIIQQPVTITGSEGAITTIIDAGGSNNRVISFDATTGYSIIEGVTITGGYVKGLISGGDFQPEGGGIRKKSNQSILTVRECIIRNNKTEGYNASDNFSTGGNAYGGGLASIDTVINCIIYENTALGGPGRGYGGGNSNTAGDGGFGQGGGMSSCKVVINNTIYKNAAIGGRAGNSNTETNQAFGGQASGGGIYLVSICRNNIIALDSCKGGPNRIGGNANSQYGGLMDATIESNNLFYQNGAVQYSDGNKDSSDISGKDPLFMNPDSHDFHISISSPAKNKGNSSDAPKKDFDGMVRPSSPSIGAFEPINKIGINKFNNTFQEVTLRPNPGNGFFYIATEEIQSQLEIFVFDLSGKELLRVHHENCNDVEINLSTFKKGIYFIKVNSDKFKIPLKAVIR